MSYFETVTAARISRRADDPPLDNNQEYVATASASLAGLFQTVPPAGGFSQTQVNTEAGARTRLCEIVTAAWAIVIAVVLAPVLADLPEATLAAVGAVAVVGLMSVDDLARLSRIDRAELYVAVITAVAALAFNLFAGVIVGVVLTFYLVLRALNHPVVVELRRATETGGLRTGPAR